MIWDGGVMIGCRIWDGGVMMRDDVSEGMKES